MSKLYFYSAETNGFYAGSMQDDYKSAGSWPDDVIEISERWYSYLLEGQTAGEVVAPNEYGQPVLVNPPEPTQAELIDQAEATKAALMVTASAAIAPLEDAGELGIATEDEVAALIRWKRYRVMLSRLDISTAPSIEWPELPA